ncbi:MAG: hypothetical protein AABW81_04295 [Nanoarchaeota archaeon]
MTNICDYFINCPTLKVLDNLKIDKTDVVSLYCNNSKNECPTYKHQKINYELVKELLE